MTEYDSTEELVEAHEAGEIESFAEYQDAFGELYDEGMDLDEQYTAIRGLMGMLSEESEAKIRHAGEVAEDAEEFRRRASAVAGAITRFQRDAAEEAERYQETIEELFHEYRTTVHAVGGNLEQVNDILDDAQDSLESARNSLDNQGDEDARQRFRDAKSEHDDLRTRMGLELEEETAEE